MQNRLAISADGGVIVGLCLSVSVLLWLGWNPLSDLNEAPRAKRPAWPIGSWVSFR
ncbi:MAG: hypothetical protein ACKN9T_07420 [Candidatus Methylumidiphilus sp.]